MELFINENRDILIKIFSHHTRNDDILYVFCLTKNLTKRTQSVTRLKIIVFPFTNDHDPPDCKLNIELVQTIVSFVAENEILELWTMIFNF